MVILFESYGQLYTDTKRTFALPASRYSILMSMTRPLSVHQKIGKRLLPLYIAAFFQGFVLWYAVEKLFMRSIGFDDAGIGLMIALYSAVMLIVETPSGILADRWSRKGVLILASIALAASSIVAGLSYSPLIFLVSAGLWGVYFALYSGTYDSIVYDILLDESESAKSFDRYFGKVRFLDSVALVISSLLGGAIANLANLRTPYFASIIFTLASIVALLMFKEPQLHKAHARVTVIRQVSQTFAAVLRNRNVLPIMTMSILLSVMLYMVLEFSQVWLIALGTPAFFFGIANAVMLAGLGLGGILAGVKQLSQQQLLLLATGGFVVCSLGLILLRNTALIVTAQTLYCTLVVAASVVFSRLLHNQLASNIRAGASSAVNTMSRIIIIPLALLFGYTSREASIFQSSWLLFGLAVVAAAVVTRYFVAGASFRQNQLPPSV